MPFQTPSCNIFDTDTILFANLVSGSSPPKYSTIPDATIPGIAIIAAAPKMTSPSPAPRDHFHDGYLSNLPSFNIYETPTITPAKPRTAAAPANNTKAPAPVIAINPKITTAGTNANIDKPTLRLHFQSGYLGSFGNNSNIQATPTITAATPRTPNNPNPNATFGIKPNNITDGTKNKIDKPIIAEVFKSSNGF